MLRSYGIAAFVCLCLSVVGTSTAQFARIQVLPGQVDRTQAFGGGNAVVAANGDVLAFFLEYGQWTDTNSSPWVGTPAYVKVTRTSDGGATWSASSTFLASIDQHGSQGIGRPRAALLPSGRLVVSVWYLQAPFPNFSAGVRTFTSDDHGQTWSEIGTKPSDILDLEVTQGGDLVSMDVVNDFTQGKQIFHSDISRDGGQTWEGMREILSAGPGTVCGQDLHVDGTSGDWMFVYADCWFGSGGSNTIYRMTSSDEGATWSAATVLTTAASTTGGTSPALAQGADGTLWLVYGSNDRLTYRTSADGGATWSDPVQWTAGTRQRADMATTCTSTDLGPLCVFGSPEGGSHLRSHFGIPGTSFDPRLVGTSVEEAGDVPSSFSLHQNYPNPFNPATTIRFDLARASEVTLTLHDVLGRTVRELSTGRHAAGAHEVRLDAAGLPSGLYLYRLQANGETMSRRMSLVR